MTGASVRGGCTPFPDCRHEPQRPPRAWREASPGGFLNLPPQADPQGAVRSAVLDEREIFKRAGKFPDFLNWDARINRYTVNPSPDDSSASWLTPPCLEKHYVW